MFSKFMPCAILLAFIMAAGCDNPLSGVGSGGSTRVAGGRNNRSTPRSIRTPNTPEGVFRGIWQACIDGRFTDAHAMYSQRLQRVITIGKIANIYGSHAARAKARKMLGGARFKLDHYAGNHAFSKVSWPDGTRQDLTFVREAGRWKLDITPVKR